jgi:hypothetical protein
VIKVIITLAAIIFIYGLYLRPDLGQDFFNNFVVWVCIGFIVSSLIR